MKSRAYWRQRFEILESATHGKGIEYLESLDREYRIASEQVQADVARWYAKFAANNDISLADAKRLLTAGELEEFRWTVEEYIRYGRENALSDQWIRQLENASARVHISRLDALHLQMQQSVERLYSTQSDGIDSLLRDVYTSNFYHSAFEIQRGVGVGVALQGISTAQLDAILAKPWSTDGRTFSDRIWTRKTELVNTLQTKMSQIIMRGESPDKAIKEIAERFGASKSQAGNLVMTESAYFSSQAQKDCYNELDIERYQILATLDHRTSEVCQDLDGAIFRVADYEPGVTAPPFHPRCRTTTIPYIEGDTGERIARGADGRTYNVPADMTYHEWFDKYVKNDPSEMAAYKGKRNEKSDRVQFKKYRAIYGADAPNTLEDFWEMKYNKIEEWEALKAGKQARLNSLSYSKKLDGLLGDYEVRKWYTVQDRQIPLKIDSSLPLPKQALQAHGLRNTYKTQARSMMANRAAALELDEVAPIEPFEYYFNKYNARFSNLGDVYRAIIDSATRPNQKINDILGVE